MYICIYVYIYICIYIYMYIYICIYIYILYISSKISTAIYCTEICTFCTERPMTTSFWNGLYQHPPCCRFTKTPGCTPLLWTEPICLQRLSQNGHDFHQPILTNVIYISYTTLIYIYIYIYKYLTYIYSYCISDSTSHNVIVVQGTKRACPLRAALANSGIYMTYMHQRMSNHHSNNDF